MRQPSFCREDDQVPYVYPLVWALPALSVLCHSRRGVRKKLQCCLGRSKTTAAQTKIDFQGEPLCTNAAVAVAFLHVSTFLPRQVPTYVVLPRGAHPSVSKFLALHLELFPILGLELLDPAGVRGSVILDVGVWRLSCTHIGETARAVLLPKDHI